MLDSLCCFRLEVAHRMALMATSREKSHQAAI
jgi:hypothetical protein